MFIVRSQSKAVGRNIYKMNKCIQNYLEIDNHAVLYVIQMTLQFIHVLNQINQTPSSTITGYTNIRLLNYTQKTTETTLHFWILDHCSYHNTNQTEWVLHNMIRSCIHKGTTDKVFSISGYLCQDSLFCYYWSCSLLCIIVVLNCSKK